MTAPAAAVAAAQYASPGVNELTVRAIPTQYKGMRVGRYFDPAKEAECYGHWSDGLYDCFSDCSLCFSAFCSTAQVVYVLMKLLPMESRDLVMVSDPSCAKCCCLCCPCCIINGVNKAIAARYNILEEFSWLRFVFCYYCSLARSNRHVNRAQGIRGLYKF